MTERPTEYDATDLAASEQHVRTILVGIANEDVLNLLLSLVRLLKTDPTTPISAASVPLGGRLFEAVHCAEVLLGQPSSRRGHALGVSPPPQTAVGAPGWLIEVEELLLKIAKDRNIKVEQASP